MLRRKFWAIAGAGLGVIACTTAWAEPPKPGVAAVVGGETITTAELDARALKTNMKLAQSLYDARKQALDQLIMEKLLGPEAKAKSVAVDKLLQDKIAEKVKPVTDGDIESYYKGNSARMGGKTLEQVSAQIKSFLVTQGETLARDGILAQLKEKADVKVTLDPPRMEVAVAANDPVKGPKDAKVTIVEFSEFQ